jgi:uncharacterized repeat protein (TIGR03803 family)
MSRKIFSLRSALAVLVLTLGASYAWPATEKVLYSFAGGSDGQFPNSGVVFDKTGNLYGTTEQGQNGAVIFELSPGSNGSWTETVLHTFSDNAEGDSPSGPLIFDSAGNIYGVCSGGGQHSDGVVYELSPVSGGGWSYNVIYNFGSREDDGGGPATGVIIDSAGNLYGTTYGGGDHGQGTVFKLSPDADGVWTESILHSFPANAGDGQYPSSGLVEDTSGNLYGTTNFGAKGGVAYRVAESQGVWAETVIHNFYNKTDGSNPSGGLVLDQLGNLYGATLFGPLGQTSTCWNDSGCGTIFRISPGSNGGWAESLLYKFPRLASVGALLRDSSGNLYGTEQSGDSVFELSPSSGGVWTELQICQFGGAGRSLPRGGLTFDGVGNLYGTTFGGGADGAGVVYEIIP